MFVVVNSMYFECIKVKTRDRVRLHAGVVWTAFKKHVLFILKCSKLMLKSTFFAKSVFIVSFFSHKMGVRAMYNE